MSEIYFGWAKYNSVQLILNTGLGWFEWKNSILSGFYGKIIFGLDRVGMKYLAGLGAEYSFVL